MTDVTLLDQTHADMLASPDDDTARLRFYERMADGELFLMLATDASDNDDEVTPELFDVEGAQYVLVFDREARLAAFAGQVTPYVALSGRMIASMLAGQGIGLALNPDVAPSAILLPPSSVDWLDETLGNEPEEVQEQIEHVSAPIGLPEPFLQSLDTKLATAMGLADAAYLVGVTYSNGVKGHLLAFVGALAPAQDALAHAASEALIFSGIEAGQIDIAFFDRRAPIVEKLGRFGLRFDLPQMQDDAIRAPGAPGMDPDRPPKLK